MVAEKFQIYGVKITGKYIHTFVSQKTEFGHFYLCHQDSPPGFYHYPSSRRKLPIPPEQRFLKICFSPGESWGIMELKKLLKLN